MADHGIELIGRLDSADTLGEGVVWDARNSCIWWTDIEGCRLHRSFTPFTSFETFSTPERIGSFALVEGRDDIVLAAFASGFAFFDYRSGAVDWIAQPDMPPGARLNDGRTDHSGRFWAGVMIEDAELSDGRKGALYRLDGRGQAVETVTDIAVSNSLCWSPDGSVMYHGDSAQRTIWRYDMQGATPVNRAVFAQTQKGGGFPDGASVDADGYLWSASWGAGKVTRYSPDGKIDLELNTPAPHVACTGFGGPDLDLLFVATARIHLRPEKLEQYPGSGSLFIFKTPFKGVAEPRCRLSP